MVQEERDRNPLLTLNLVPIVLLVPLSNSTSGTNFFPLTSTDFMANFTYTLDPSSRKFFCPECGKKRFVRYINKETKEYHEDESLGWISRSMLTPYYGKK